MAPTPTTMLLPHRKLWLTETLALGYLSCMSSQAGLGGCSLDPLDIHFPLSHPDDSSPTVLALGSLKEVPTG
jgi:hypothetical protein